MNSTKKMIIAVIAFSIIVVVIQFIYMPAGQIIKDWNVINVDEKSNGTTIEESRSIQIPFSEDIPKPGLYEFSSLVYPDDMNANALNIRRINGYAFEVILNGQSIYYEGDFNTPTANLWNHSYLIHIPENLLLQENIFTIRVYGLHDIGFIFAPTLGQREQYNTMVTLQNIVSDGLSYVIIGSSLVLGILLLLIGVNRKKYSNNYYIQFGLGFILFAIYNQEFIYRNYSGSLELYLAFRKVLIVSIMLAMGFLVLGLLNYLYQYHIKNNVKIVYVLLLLPILFSNNFHILKTRTSIFNIVIILMTIILTIIVFKNPKRQLRFSVTFLFLAIIHAIIIFTFSLPYITHVSIGISVFLIGITYSIVTEFVQLHSDNIQLDLKATVDVLTSAYNREYLERINAREKDSFIFIDIDYFKVYNDTLGHHMGDLLLVELVNKMKSIIRGNDAIVRYGGDEFIIYLQQVSLDRANEIAFSIKQFVKENYEYLDISFGVSEFVTDTNETIKVADKFMYQMKELKKH